MYLNPRRLEETCDQLNAGWQEWQQGPRYQADKEVQEIEMFLDIQRAFASSIDNAYIDAWYERYQQSKK